MGELGLKRLVCKVRYLSYNGTAGKTTPNILKRDFKAAKLL